MATGRRGTTEGPLALVASIAARRGGHRRSAAAALTEQVRGLREGAAGVIAGPLPKALAKRLPSRRKRKSFVKRAGRRLDGLSKVASGAATALTVAAAAAELASSLRSQGEEEGRQGGGRQQSSRQSGSGRNDGKGGGTTARSKSNSSSKPRQSKQEAMRHAS